MPPENRTVAKNMIDFKTRIDEHDMACSAKPDGRVKAVERYEVGTLEGSAGKNRLPGRLPRNEGPACVSPALRPHG